MTWELHIARIPVEITDESIHYQSTLTLVADDFLIQEAELAIRQLLDELTRNISRKEDV